MEATAEDSLARCRERRKLGTAMAEMIRMTATTRSNSISENPFRFLINSPEADSSVRLRGCARSSNHCGVLYYAGGHHAGIIS
jgi:hypothetical protein